MPRCLSFGYSLLNWLGFSFKSPAISGSTLAFLSSRNGCLRGDFGLLESVRGRWWYVSEVDAGSRTRRCRRRQPVARVRTPIWAGNFCPTIRGNFTLCVAQLLSRISNIRGWKLRRPFPKTFARTVDNLESDEYTTKFGFPALTVTIRSKIQPQVNIQLSLVIYR